jgi:hypothetical protein
MGEPMQRKRRMKVSRVIRSVGLEGSAYAKPATTPTELLDAFKMVGVLMLKEKEKGTDDTPSTLAMTLARCLALLMKEGFRLFGIPAEFQAWLDNPDADQTQMLPLLGLCWSMPGYPEETGAAWPPPKINEFEARNWPEQVYALMQHAITIEDRVDAHTCLDLALFLEGCYQKRLHIGLQRKTPPLSH